MIAWFRRLANWFRSRRALLRELAEYQTAFDALAKSFERHRIATKKTADLQQQTIARLDLALDRMRLTAGVGIARPPRPRFDRTAARLRQQGVPADLVEAIDEETAMKRREDI